MTKPQERGIIKVAKYVSPTYERLDNPDSKGKFFVRLAYGVVGSYMDTKPMKTSEVIEEFLTSQGVRTPGQFFREKFKGGNKVEEKTITTKEEQQKNLRDLQSNIPKAETTREAEILIKEKIGIDVDYQGMDVDVANAMNSSFSIACQFCPGITENFKTAGTAQARNRKMKQIIIDYYTDQYELRGYSTDRAKELAKKSATKTMKSQKIGVNDVAFSWTANTDFSKKYLSECQGIFINKSFTKDISNLDKIMQEQVRIGFHPQGCGTMKATMDHECGHQISDYLEITKDNEMLKFFNECAEKNEIRKGLSIYAAENINEFVAEGYAEYINNPEPRPIAKKIGEIIIKANEERNKNDKR